MKQSAARHIMPEGHFMAEGRFIPSCPQGASCKKLFAEAKSFLMVR